MLFQGSVPGKTFLIGEYLALQGGPALVVNTKPRFQMQIFSEKQEDAFVPHLDSPAGKLLAAHRAQSLFLKFTDPYQGRGGFGASTAQYLLLSSYFTSVSEEDQDLDLRLLLENYRSHSLAEGTPPSGYDLIAQTVGGITYFEKNLSQLEKFQWLFPNIKLLLFATGQKLATHEHLKNLQGMNFSSLEKSAQSAVQAMKQSSQEQFIQSFCDFRLQLQNMNLVHPQTLDKVVHLEKMEGVFAKGCGAYGADVIAVVCDSAKANDVKAIAEKLGMLFQADEGDISEGLESECFIEREMA